MTVNNSDHEHRHKFDFRRFYEAPSLHQDWGDLQEERKVSWTELFFDLFYVVASINLSHQIEADLSIQGFGKFFLFLSFFWCIWVAHTIYQSRIRLIGLAFDYLSLIHMLGVLGMILHCTDTQKFSKFAGSYAIARLAIAVLNGVTAIHLPRARVAALSVGGVYTTVAVIALVNAAVAKWHVFVGLSILCLALEFISPLIPVFVPAARLPVHVDHVNERYGLIMMIFLGETVVSLGKSTLSYSAQQYLAIAFACVVVYNLHLVYYHTSPDQHSHALRLHRYRGFAWSYTHWLLCCAFLMLSAGIRLSISSYIPPSSSSSSGHRRLLAAAAEAPTGHSPAAPAADHAAPMEHSSAPVPASAYDGHGAKHYEFNAGHIPMDVAWLLCISYAAGLHLMALIRTTHYLFNPIIRCASQQLGMTKWFRGWWAWVFIWPLCAYFIPWASDDFEAAGLLGFLAAHGVVYNIIETMITHKVSAVDWNVAFANALSKSQHGALVAGQPLPVVDEVCSVYKGGVCPFKAENDKRKEGVHGVKEGADQDESVAGVHV